MFARALYKCCVVLYCICIVKCHVNCYLFQLQFESWNLMLCFSSLDVNCIYPVSILLTDGQSLCDYNIGPDTKIHLVVRRPETDSDVLSTARIGSSTVLWDQTRDILS